MTTLIIYKTFGERQKIAETEKKYRRDEHSDSKPRQPRVYRKSDEIRDKKTAWKYAAKAVEATTMGIRLYWLRLEMHNRGTHFASAPDGHPPGGARKLPAATARA